MWILMLVLLLLSAHLNLTALVPLQPGGTPPPWWVGGRLAWPFALETRTLLPPGDVLNTATPILGIGAAICYLLAAAALLGWFIPPQWFSWLVVAGAVLSISLQAVWFSPWAVFPLLFDVLLLWAVFGGLGLEPQTKIKEHRLLSGGLKWERRRKRNGSTALNSR